MSTEKTDRKKKDSHSFKAINEAFNAELPDQLKKQMKKSLDGFRQDLKEHPYVRKLEDRKVGKKHPVLPNLRNIFRPLLLSGAGLACVATLALFLVGNNHPTWAEVSERLYSASNVTALIYVKSHAFSETKQIEFWRGYGDRFRIKSGNLVTFANNDFVKTFDLETRSECYPQSASGTMCYHSDAFIILRLSRKIRGASIEEAIIQGMSGSNIVDATAIINANPEISKDLVAFDADTRDDNWRIRIWALRESKLPIRISEWSPMGGRYETLLSYSKEEQPQEFFDPDAFEAVLKDTSNSIISLMYMFQRDPGNKSIPTPEN
jgi:hypothetical protein